MTSPVLKDGPLLLWVWEKHQSFCNGWLGRGRPKSVSLGITSKLTYQVDARLGENASPAWLKVPIAVQMTENRQEDPEECNPTERRNQISGHHMRLNYFKCHIYYQQHKKSGSYCNAVRDRTSFSMECIQEVYVCVCVCVYTCLCVYVSVCDLYTCHIHVPH